MKPKLFLAFLFLGSVSFSQAQISLDSCRVWARENYPLIEQFGLISESEKLSLKEVNTYYIPQFNFSAIGGVLDGFPQMSAASEDKASPWKLIGIAQFNQTIWDGGALLKRKKIIKAGAEVERQNTELALYALDEKVFSSFFSILLLKEQVLLLEEEQKNIANHLKAVSSAVENGKSYPSDLEELQLAGLELDRKKIQLEKALESSCLILSTLTAKEINTKSEIIKPSALLTDKTDMETRPEAILLDKQKDYLKAHNVGAMEILPTLSLMGYGVFITPEQKFMLSGTNHLLVAGINVSWKIGGRAYSFGADQKRLGVELRKIETQKEAFLFNTAIEQKQRRTELEKWRECLVKDAEILNLRSKLRKDAELKYEGGLISLSELLDYISKEVAAKQEMGMHEIQYLMEVSNYKHVSGTW